MSTVILEDPDLQALDNIWPMGRTLILPGKATVVVAGCYKGRYIDYLCTLYPQIDRILGYEPQPWAAYVAEQRNLKHGPKVEIYPWGLATEEMSHQMSKWGTDGCSLLAPSKDSAGDIGEARFADAESIFKFLNSDLDLFVMNMEGYENELIPHMYKMGLLKRIGSMAVQFHPTPQTEDQEPAMSILAECYGTPLYCDWPTWSYWRK